VAQPAARGVVILPGLGNAAADYEPLAALLRRRGLDVEIAAVGRADWSRNAAALTDAAWWKGELKPRPATDWFMTRLDGAMAALQRRVPDAPVTMLAHSAGGWLGRAYMADFGTQAVRPCRAHLAPLLPAAAAARTVAVRVAPTAGAELTHR